MTPSRTLALTEKCIRRWSHEARSVKRFSGRGQSMYVPKVIGQTSEAETRKRPEGRQWDEGSFFQELAAKRGADEVAAARQILEWAKARMSRIWFGRGQNNGSFIPVYDQNGIGQQSFAVWTYGTVEISFYWNSKPPFNSEDKRRDLLRRLNEIQGVHLPDDSITRRPGIPLSALAKPESLDLFLKTFEWFVEEVRKQ
jgi:hypothetical protein